jgi:hypothetical protein
VNQTCSFRGSKSRNKVSVGEPAEGSLTRFNKRFQPIREHYQPSQPLDAGSGTGASRGTGATALLVV